MPSDYVFETVDLLGSGFVNQKIYMDGKDAELTLTGTFASGLNNDTYFQTKQPDVTRKYFYYTLDSKSANKLLQLSTKATTNTGDLESSWKFMPCVSIKPDKKSEVRFKIKFHEDVLVMDTTCNNHDTLSEPKGCKARIVCEPNVYFNCDDHKYGMYFNVKQIIF